MRVLLTTGDTVDPVPVTLVAADRLATVVTAPDFADSRLWPGEIAPWPAGLCIRIRRSVWGRTMEGEATPADTGSLTTVPGAAFADPVLTTVPAGRTTVAGARTDAAALGRTGVGAPAEISTQNMTGLFEPMLPADV